MGTLWSWYTGVVLLLTARPWVRRVTRCLLTLLALGASGG
jgi:hypothetical protein